MPLGSIGEPLPVSGKLEILVPVATHWAWVRMIDMPDTMRPICGSRKRPQILGYRKYSVPTGVYRHCPWCIAV